MCTFQIYSNAAKSLFRVPSNVLNQIRCLNIAHQFKMSNVMKYPNRDLMKQEESILTSKMLQRKNDSTRTMDRRNYYSALGVDKNADQKEIKRAYYALARKFHPDSTKDSTILLSEKKFQEITEAYAVLSDEKKRREYDLYGIVKNANKTLPNTKLMEAKERSTHPVAETIDYKSENVIFDNPTRILNESTLKLTFLEAVRGASKDLTISTMKQCSRCSGSNDFLFEKNLIVCDKCYGSGLQPTIGSRGKTVRTVCKSCRGRRYVPQNPCSECGGRGIKITNMRVEVNIPPGSNSGDVVKFIHPNSGQNIAIRLNVAHDDNFSRIGNDIYSDLPITLSQAVLGGVVTVKGIYENHKVVLKPGTESGTKIRLIDKGVKTKSAVGDHFLKVCVRIPKMLTTKQKALMSAFAETEVEGSDQKAELRKSRIKEELANLHNLNRDISSSFNFPIKPSMSTFFNHSTRNKSYSYRAL